MIALTLYETRVIGVLFEKEHTTPDQYPLSLNALTNGCNQKSNREPVLELSEVEVQDTVDSLLKKGLVTTVSVGSRVAKYRQRFGNTEFGDFKFTLKEQSLLSVLFLRGPQTAGELRLRTQRLCEFADVADVERVLDGLAGADTTAYVVKLPREPGKRECRYAHLFSGEVEFESIAEIAQGPRSVSQAVSDCSCVERVAELEQQVSVLQEEVEWLKAQWQTLNG
ncbi:DUF480 domain-containing protein [Simiduia curdlanivorans]|uniref:YceH family protein n=1 Tax=Simiduia curdlanivorans TaxID=1492769 RepID=A0ABV8V5E4_9GAMM|nr:DUF480 domain-containing protein [Simiduia curdlanivorans]MDN3640932.1 DUF480 domain-containing protein [Simiduia curdlanivorans]